MALKEKIDALLPETLSHLESWVRINSFSTNPDGVNAVADAVAQSFAPLGFKAERVLSDDSSFGSHLFLTREGTSDTTIALVAHLDTVYPAEEEVANDFHWLPEGDRIYGPGTCDDKGGIAMIWLMLASLREEPVFREITWIVALNASEEHLALDFPERCRERFPSSTRACLVFEGCGWDTDGTLRVVTARKGSANFRLAVEGRSAHAGSNLARGANAIHELALLIPEIEALTDYQKGLTVNVGIIRGGVADNRVPHHAEAIINMRSFQDEVLNEGILAIQRIAESPSRVRAASDGFPCQIRLELTSRNAAWPSNPETDALFSLWRQTARELHVSFEKEQRGGLSDANRLWQIAPTLDGLGPVGDNDHCSVRSADGSQMPEYVLPASFPTLAELNVRAILQLVS